MPHLFFLAHQAMADMPFVAALTVAVCLLLVAWSAGPDELDTAQRRSPRVAVESKPLG